MKANLYTTLLVLIVILLNPENSYSCGGPGNTPPEADLKVMPTSYVPTDGSVTFDGTGSFDLDGSGGLNGIYQFAWDFLFQGTFDVWCEEWFSGGNSCDDTFDGKVTRPYGNFGAGTYTVRLRVRDALGAFGFADCTVHVTDVLYVNQAVIGGDNNGMSWDNAFIHLQDALDVAQPGHQIWVAAGTYYPDEDSHAPYHSNDDRNESFQLVEGVELYGGFAGGETSLDERDWQANKSILSGDLMQNDVGDIDDPTRADNSYHVVTGTDNALFDGFTVTDGHADGSGTDAHGGGMYNANANVTVANCVFSLNDADDGGGIYCNESDTQIINSVFVGNNANSNGGGIHGFDSFPSVINCTISDNDA